MKVGGATAQPGSAEEAGLPIHSLGQAAYPDGIPVELVGDLGDLATNNSSILARWWSLAELASDRNPFAEPWVLVPALQYLAALSPRVRLFGATEDGGQLIGLVPVAPTRLALGQIWSVWTNTHCLDTTPLVRPGDIELFCTKFFGWLSRQRARLLWWPALPLDTDFSKHLLDHLDITGRRWFAMREKQRPILRLREFSPEDYVERALSKKRRKNLERYRRRLCEAGRLEFRVLDGGDSLERWTDVFLTLEASGWKGAAGSAMRCRRAEEAFFRSAISGGMRRNKVQFNVLEVEHRPVAMNVNFICGNGMWGFRTAYDERYTSHAPGVVAALEEACAAMKHPGLEWMDPCNLGDNKLYAEMYPHRRPVADLMIAVRPRARAHFLVARAGYRVGRLGRKAANAVLTKSAIRKAGRRCASRGGK